MSPGNESHTTGSQLFFTTLPPGASLREVSKPLHDHHVKLGVHLNPIDGLWYQPEAGGDFVYCGEMLECVLCHVHKPRTLDCFHRLGTDLDPRCKECKHVARVAFADTVTVVDAVKYLNQRTVAVFGVSPHDIGLEEGEN